MINLFLLLFLQSFVNGQEITESTESNDAKIVGGKIAKPSVYTFVVSLQHSSDSSHICGGVLASNKHVLSACSCMIHKQHWLLKWKWEFIDSALYKLVVGGTDKFKHAISRLPVPDGSTQVREILEYYIHPNCRREGPIAAFADDLMIFIAKTPFTLTENIHPMQIYSLDENRLNDRILEITENKMLCEVAGYGLRLRSDIQSEHYTDYLHVLEIQLINNFNCRKLLCKFKFAYCRYNPRKYNQICAVPWLNRSHGTGPCTGDTGGPLICHGRVYGILVWSKTCGYGTFHHPILFQSLGKAVHFYKEIYLNARSIKSNIILIIMSVVVRIFIKKYIY